MFKVKYSERRLSDFSKTTSETIRAFIARPPIPAMPPRPYVGSSPIAAFLSNSVRYEVSNGRITMGFHPTALVNDPLAMDVHNALKSGTIGGTPLSYYLRLYAERITIPYMRYELARRLRRA